MKSLLIASLTLALAAQPALAASIADHPSAAQHRVGTFAGARFRIAMGGEHSGQARLGLAIAGLDYRQAGDGRVSVRFADGAEFGLAADRKLRLSLAGRTMTDRRLRLQEQGEDNDGGISTGVLIAGGVLIALGIGVALYADALNDASE